MDATGVQLGVSYTRVDEPGSCYLAAGWIPAALVEGRAHTTGNRAQRSLPGLYEPSTEIVDRVRWERGPRAAKRPGARWDAEASRWLALNEGVANGVAVLLGWLLLPPSVQAKAA